MCDNWPKKAKRTFVEAWLNDDRCKSWIRKVSFDDSLFHCIVCNKNMSCSSLSHVLRHADSASHKTQIKEKTLPVLNNDDVNSKQNKTYQQQFKQEWLEIEQFKPWLRKASHDENSFFCSICDKSFVCSLSKIHRHAQSQTHMEICKKNGIESNMCNEENEMQTDECVLSFEDRKKYAEIRYAALIATKNLSHQTAKDILNFFQEVGKDFNVLKSMAMGKTKCTKVMSNVLCPVETDRVVNNIKNTKFSIYIDETSDSTNEKWMTFLVRYVDHETLDIRTQLVKLINVDAKDCSADKLFNAFKCEMSKLHIPFSNIVALACDNASVMTGKHLSFKTKLVERCKNVLTFSCPCHSSALIAHAACSKIPEHCEEFLKKIASFINGSPKRSAIYREFSDCFQETNRKILKLCETRWLSRHNCITRVIEGWDTIKYFLSEMVISEKTKSGEELLCILNKVDTKAYFLFLKFVLHVFNSFNAFFQAAETRIHFLQPHSANFLLQICTKFLKQEHWESPITNVVFSEKENQKALHEIILGKECEEYLRDLVEEGHMDIVTTIRENCLAFYVTAAEGISKRLPVNNVFLSKLAVFGPSMTLNNINREQTFNDIAFVAETIGGFNLNALKEEWMALPLHLKMEEKLSLSKLSFDNMWKKICHCEDANNFEKYPNLKKLLNAVRALPNSNADAERVFSMLTDIKTKKRNSLSADTVNAICVVKSALKARNENVLNMEINPKHLSFMSTDELYKNSSKKEKSCLNLYSAHDIGEPSTSRE